MSANLRTALLTTTAARSPAALVRRVSPLDDPFGNAAEAIARHMGAPWLVKPIAPPADVTVDEYVLVMRAMKLAAYAARTRPAEVPADFADAADVRDVLANPAAYRPEYVALVRAMRDGGRG